MNFNSRYLEGIWNHLGVSLWHSTEVEGKSTVPFCFNQIWILFASTKCKYGYMDVFKSTSVGNHDDKMLIYFTVCLSLFTCNISDSYRANRQMNSILYILFSSHCCLGCRVFWHNNLCHNRDGATHEYLPSCLGRKTEYFVLLQGTAFFIINAGHSYDP